MIECHFYLRELLKAIVSAIQSCPKELNRVKLSLELLYLTAIKSTQAWDVVVTQRAQLHAGYSGSDLPVTRDTFPRLSLVSLVAVCNLIEKECVQGNIKNSYVVQTAPTSGNIVPELNQI